VLDEINIAIDKGTDFIRSRQCEDGLWRDFDTLAGTGSDWVSGFITFAISSTGSLNETILQAQKTLASRQRPNGGWSYNKTVPTDCDSTAWVMLALSTSPNWRPSAIKRGIRYIELHQDKTLGGFVTYSYQDGIHKFIQASKRDIVRGWVNAHIDVTSIAIQSLLVHRVQLKNEIIKKASLFLMRQRNNHCIWNSYWWKGYAYSTYNALKALIMSKTIDSKEVLQTIKFLIAKQQKDDGWNDSFGVESEVFGTALIILSLLLNPNDQTLYCSKKGIRWLISQQDNDGSWSSSPILKIPPSMIINPDFFRSWRNNEMGTGVIIEDKRRLFTSSVALWALKQFKSMIQ